MKTYHWSCRRYALLSSIVVALLSPCASSSSPTAPTHLRSFDKVHPVGTDSRPYFGWYVNDPDDDEIQMAYQILVATSQDKLDAGQGDLWDSGQVKSAAQNYVYHEGRALAHGRRYYWKVRTWDKNGNVSPYSAPGQFDTGLFTTRHWAGAKWIRRDTEEADDYTYYRRQVLLPDHMIQRAIVYVTAGHNYELYLNGTLVGQGLAYHYPQYHYYNAFDVTSALTSQTDNTFAALTHWYGGGQGRARGARGFLLKAVIEYVDGTTTVIGTDRHWKQTRAEAWVTGQRQRNGEGVGYIDRIDARKLMPGWQTGEYDDSAWSAATEIGAPPVAPWTSSLQPDLTRVIEEEIVPVSVTGLGGGTYVIDLGKVYAGMPKITFSGGESGTTVNMRGGYTLNDDGTVSTRTDQNTTMSYYFVLDGGTAVFHPGSIWACATCRWTTRPSP